MKYQQSLGHGYMNILRPFSQKGTSDEVITKVLNAALDFFDADRAYIFQHLTGPGDKIYLTQKYEVVKGSVSPQLDHPDLQISSYDDLGFSRWAEAFARDRVIAGPVDSFPDVEQAFLEEQDIQSLAAIPISVNDQVWGFWGLDICHQKRVWNPIEIELLRTIAFSLGGFFMQGATIKRLRVSRQALHKAQEIGHIGSFSYDLEAGQWLFSEGFIRIFGHFPNDPSQFQAIGLSIMSREQYGIIRDAFSKVIRNPEQSRSEGQMILRLQGEEKYFSYLLESEVIDGKTRNIYGFVQDVTEKVLADKDIRNTTANLYAILESTQDIFFSLDLHYCVSLFNSSFADLVNKWMGIRIRSGLNLTDVLNQQPNKRRSQVQIALLKQVMDGKSLRAPLNIMLGDDNLRQFELSLNPILDESGQVEGLSVFGKDVTDRNQQEKEIRLLNSRLEKRVKQRTEELQKTNKELEHFAYSVSHDLRTPLRHLIAYSKLLREKAADQLTPETLPYLEFLSSSASKMNKLIEDLLAYSRLGRKEINRMMLNPNEILPGLFDYFQVQTPEASLHFEVDIQRNLYADPVLLETLLTNLISNSVKYRQKDQACRIKVRTTAFRNGTMLEVIDNGIGFDMKYVDQVFGIFKRLHSDEEYEGSGIGMANVQRIMSRHQGSISAASEKGKGACFSCFFPDPDDDL